MPQTVELTEEQKKYRHLEDEIRRLLQERLGQGVLEVDDIIAITLELGRAKTINELKAAILKIADKYPVIRDVLITEEKEKRESMHEFVQEFLSVYVQKDPLKAAKLAELALKKGITMEELFKFSPEFKEFYEKHK